MKYSTPGNQTTVSFFTLIFATTLVAVTPLRSDDASEKVGKLNGGYFLLHDLSEDEDQVPILLDIKHSPPELRPFADNISKTAKETLTALDRLQQNDSSLRFDRNPLPAIEQDVRASIKSDKQHQLLFGTTNSEFVRAFLIAQIEACTYGTNLCKVLADQETNQDRVRTLRHLSTKWLTMRDDAFRILRNY
jgi:hypothetical protein